MKRWTVISSVVSILFVASILTLDLSTRIASASDPPKQECKGHHKNDVGCNGGGGGGGDTYSMVFSGVLPGGSNGDTYLKDTGNGIGGVLRGNLQTRINLTFFADLPMPAGVNCFGGGVDHVSGHTFNPWGVSVRQGRRGRAEATVIFRAQTVNGDPAVYSLHTVGIFETNDWPPSDVNVDAILKMTSFEMLLNNHNPSDLMGACLSEGPFDDPDTPLPVEETWQITVSLDP